MMLFATNNHVSCIPAQFGAFLYYSSNKMLPSLTYFSFSDHSSKLFRGINWRRSLVSPKRGDISILQLWVSKVRGGQIHNVQMAIGKICTRNIGLEHIYVCEFSSAQVCVSKRSSEHVCSDERCAVQIRMEQIHVLEICINERRVRNVQTRERRTGQIGLIEKRFPSLIFLNLSCGWNTFSQEAGNIQSLLKIWRERRILGRAIRNTTFGLLSDEVKQKIQYHNICVRWIAFHQLSQSINAGKSHSEFLALQHLRAFLKTIYYQAFFCKFYLIICNLSLPIRSIGLSGCCLGAVPRQNERRDSNNKKTKISNYCREAFPFFLRPIGQRYVAAQQKHGGHHTCQTAGEQKCYRPVCSFFRGVSGAFFLRLFTGIHAGGVQKVTKNRTIKPERARLCNWRVAA